MSIKLALKEYGLAEKEIEVYLLLLKLSKANLQEIAKRLDFPRTTVYNTLSYLHHKGLVSKIIMKGVTHYEAAQPEKFLDKLEEKKRLIEKVLPQMQEIKELVTESSSVEIYEGSKGLFTVLSDVFKTKQQTHYFGSYKLSLEVLRHQPHHFRTIRLERGIKAKIIVEPCDEKIFGTKRYKDLTQMRFLESLKEFPCMIFMYGNKVAMYTLKGDLIGIIIKNEQVAKAMLMMFTMMWETAKE